MKTYTEKEVVKLLADFGTHVAEQCTGKKLEIAGELMKWWKLNIPAVVGQSEQLKAFADYVQRRMWEGEDKDLSEFVEEFLSL